MGLGKRTGSTRINRYEQQASLCDMTTAAAIAQQLGVPLAYLFAETDDQAELLLAFAKLTKAERAKVLAEAQQLASTKPPSKTKG